MINEEKRAGKSTANVESWAVRAPELRKKWMRGDAEGTRNKIDSFDKGKFLVMWSKKKMTLKKREMGRTSRSRSY